MNGDPVLRFKDGYGNDYVGLDVVDAENLASVLTAALDVLSSLALHEELTDYLPAAGVVRITDELADQLSLVRQLLGNEEVVPSA